MRVGYASALVSRSRGRAPLLRPATPSRFEPETRPGDLGDNMTIGSHVEATPEAPAASSRAERLIHEPPVGRPQPWAPDEPDEPLLGLGRPEEGGLFDARATLPSEPAHQAATDDEPDRRHRIAPTRAPRSGQSRIPGERAAERSASEPTESASRPWAFVDSPAAIEVPQPTPQPTSPVEQLVVTRRAEHEYLPAVRSSRPVEQGAAEPPIIVRIGRLDVRAVQAPPAPRAEARPRRQTGPTLEERLLARDRQ